MGQNINCVRGEGGEENTETWLAVTDSKMGTIMITRIYVIRQMLLEWWKQGQLDGKVRWRKGLCLFSCRKWEKLIKTLSSK
jgi:hypothetical protein